MSLDAAAAGRLGTVRVVGTGLLGASVALGLRAGGARVLLSDTSPTALALARDVGAGEVDTGEVEPEPGGRRLPRPTSPPASWPRSWPRIPAPR